MTTAMKPRRAAVVGGGVIGGGWVARLMERAEVPAADGAAIAAGLNERLGAGWEAAGGLIPICKTRWVDAPPDAVIAALAEVDAAAS